MSPGVRFDADDPRLAAAVWSRIAEPGDPQACDLVDRLGVVAALRTVIDRLPGTETWHVRLPDANPERDLATIRRFGGRLVVPADAEWPAGLAALGSRAPWCLWVRGGLDLAEATRRAVAVVGSRAATPYGEHVAGQIGAGCADRGFTVISGAAYGIDGAGHRGSLAGGGPTVAVLACGADRCYPQGHRTLVERIAAEGLLLSEVAPGCAPTRSRFIQRNRVIAGLARATVVVEAAWRSGAMITAHRAIEYLRPVGAVPGPVTSPMSAGCHRLLQEHGAVCVTDAAEVAELAAPMGECLLPERHTHRADHDGLSPLDLRVLDALPARGTARLPRLAQSAGLPDGVVLAAVARLRARGLAVPRGEGWTRGYPTRPPP
jgi:DNA processing protein